MSKIRETVISNCEKNLLIRALKEWTRLDGRAFEEFRELEIDFGKDWGCCCVSLGKTKVLAQTSCEIQQPKSSRPSEGILNVNLELNPLAAPNFEVGRQSELSVQLNRLLEKCIKDSKAVDLESLCIKTSEKVWAFRVDLNALNHEGNILDCASVAMLASLAHFRRPDVTCDGEEFVIHSYKQRDPIPTVIHHYPVCVTFAIFNGGEFIVADPTLLEEGVSDATITLGLNSFKELCGLHLGGKAELSPEVILKTINRAVIRSGTVVEQIKAAIDSDNKLRQEQDQHVGFHLGLSVQQSFVASLEDSLGQWRERRPKNKQKQRKKKKGDAGEIEELGEGSTTFVPNEDDDAKWETVTDDDVMYVETSSKVEKIEISDTGSEDDDVVILEGDEVSQGN